MRITLALLACLLLAGCPSPKPSPGNTPGPGPAVPTATPEATATATATATASPAAAPAAGYPGVWTTADENGQPFDLVLFPNGQAVTNWTRSPRGAQGERGFWREDRGEMVAVFEDGWTDVIIPKNGGFQHQGFAPGTARTSPPTNQAVAQRADGPQAAFIGVWRLNKEPDGSFLYLALQSGGRAFSTINGGTEGKWEKTEKGALCTWPDGWVDLIERTPEGWQKRSWVGAESNTADLSPAERVGEKPFEITP